MKPPEQLLELHQGHSLARPLRDAIAMLDRQGERIANLEAEVRRLSGPAGHPAAFCRHGLGALRSVSHMEERKRKSVTPRVRLRVMKRDGYRCVICGANPITTPGLDLEVDHVDPFSKGGADDETNFQTLCRQCNRGKGNDETLNKALEADLVNLLDRINPDIRRHAESGAVWAYANHHEFVALQRMNDHVEMYDVVVDRSVTSIGYGAGGGSGLRPTNDDGGQKVRFLIAPRGSIA